jgi:hypothetical protein
MIVDSSLIRHHRYIGTCMVHVSEMHLEVSMPDL